MEDEPMTITRLAAEVERLTGSSDGMHLSVVDYAFTLFVESDMVVEDIAAFLHTIGARPKGYTMAVVTPNGTAMVG